jgi:hypothetical protein
MNNPSLYAIPKGKPKEKNTHTKQNTIKQIEKNTSKLTG